MLTPSLSAIIPEESNYLLNPLHPDFGKLTFGLAEDFPFDRRSARARKRRDPRRSQRRSRSRQSRIKGFELSPRAAR